LSRSLVALAVVAAIANAQRVEAQDSAASEAMPPLEEVTVTGTSIKRGDDAALPVTIVSQEAMDLRDASTPVDLLTSLPAVVNVPINDSNQGGVSARGDIASVNLRGIGSGNTLVLLNGRRVAAHGISSTEDGVPAMSVNVNTLPSRGLERVDILRDGASAVYGSDAVAGVINFVTDSKYVGNEVQVQTGITEIGSGSDMGATLTHGSFAFDDRLHWVSTLDYFKREELKTSDLPNATDADKRAVALPGFDAANGPFFDRNASSAFPSFRVGASTATVYLTPMEGGVGFKNSAPNRSGAELGYYYDVNKDGYSVPETERISWFNGLDFKINDSLAAFGSLSLYRAESTMVRPPVAYGINSDRPLVVPIDNPYNPYGSRFYSVDGSPNADGTARLTGAPRTTTIVSKRFTDLGPETIDIETTAITATAGLRGDLAPGWSWESAAVYSRAQTKDDSLNAVRESALLAQTARTDASAFNPFGYNFAVQGNQVVPTTPYQNPDSVISPFRQKFHQEGVNVLASVDARINGELFSLGAGSPIQVAFGAEHRWDDYELTRPQFHGINGPNDLGLDPAGNDFVQASAAGNVIGDRTVVAAFAETVIPIVGDLNAMPGVQRLEFGASIRYEEYSDFGDTSNPKFTLDWRPIEPLMIRASYNEGFRAPNLSVMNYPTRFTVGSNFDPYRGPVTNLPIDGQFQRQTGIEGNPDLVPETSEGRTLGFVLDVPWVDGLRFSVDYWKIDQEDLIASPIAEEIRANDASLLLAATQAALARGIPLDQIDLGSGVEGAYAGDPLIQRSQTVSAEDRALFAAYNASRPQSQWVAPVGVLEITYTPYSNLASATIEGYDFNFTYSSPQMSWGRFGVTTDATYLHKYERQAGANAPVETRLGKNGATKWRGAVNLFWSKDDIWSAGLSAYYIGEYADTSASINAATYAQLNQPSYIFPIDGIYYWKVDDSVTFNAFGAYTFAPDGDSLLSDVNLRVGVKNLTNEDAPLTTDPAGYDSGVYNSVAMGRVWTLRLTKNF
jgi:outer membrane receptor protein involved in Fe transport